MGRYVCVCGVCVWCGWVWVGGIEVRVLLRGWVIWLCGYVDNSVERQRVGRMPGRTMLYANECSVM